MIDLVAAWRCLGVPPRVEPCGAGETGVPAKMNSAAEKHTKTTGHATTCHSWPATSEERAGSTV